MVIDVKMQRIAGHSEERFLGSDVFEGSGRNLPPPIGTGTVREDASEIAVYHRCDAVVIGGGPAALAHGGRREIGIQILEHKWVGKLNLQRGFSPERRSTLGVVFCEVGRRES